MKMSRVEFFAELKNSLFKTAKEFSYPIIENDIEKVESIVEDFSGVTWYPLTGYQQVDEGALVEYYFNKQPVVIYVNNGAPHAYSKSCQTCGGLLQWIAYDKRLTCFTCDHSFSFLQEGGELALIEYPLKRRDAQWLIGIY